MRPLRVAVVGTHYGSRFFGLYQRHPDADLAGIAGRRPEATAAIAEYVECRAYPTLQSVLEDPDVDAVHLMTPPRLHASQTVEALRAGKHVLCAPPLALSMTDLRRVLAAAAESGRVCALAETDLYGPDLEAIRADNDAGRLGAVRIGRGRHRQDLRGWPGYWRDIAPLQYSSHALAPVLWVGGWEVSSVLGVVLRGGITAVPSAQLAVARTSGGPAVEIELDLGARDVSFLKGGEVQGDLVTRRFGLTGAPQPVPAYPVYRVHGREPAAFETRPGTKHEHFMMVDDFVRAVRKGCLPRAGLRQAAHWTAVGLLADESSRNGSTWVTVPGGDALVKGEL